MIDQCKKKDRPAGRSLELNQGYRRQPGRRGERAGADGGEWGLRKDIGRAATVTLSSGGKLDESHAAPSIGRLFASRRAIAGIGTLGLKGLATDLTPSRRQAPPQTCLRGVDRLPTFRATREKFDTLANAVQNDGPPAVITGLGRSPRRPMTMLAIIPKYLMCLVARCANWDRASQDATAIIEASKTPKVDGLAQQQVAFAELAAHLRYR